MSSFTSAASVCGDDFLSWVKVSAEQVRAAGGTPEPSEPSGLQGKDLGLARAFPVPTDAPDLARHINEFLAERPTI